RPLPTPPLFPYTTLFRSCTEADNIPAPVFDRPNKTPMEAVNGSVSPLPRNLRLIKLVWFEPFGQKMFGQLIPSSGRETTAKRRQDRKSTRLNSSHVSISY